MTNTLLAVNAMIGIMIASTCSATFKGADFYNDLCQAKLSGRRYEIRFEFLKLSQKDLDIIFSNYETEKNVRFSKRPSVNDSRTRVAVIVTNDDCYFEINCDEILSTICISLNRFEQDSFANAVNEFLKLSDNARHDLTFDEILKYTKMKWEKYKMNKYTKDLIRPIYEL